MAILTWTVRLLVFLVLFAFALKNAHLVEVRFLLDAQWQLPLVILCLGFFASGAFFGVLSLLGSVFRLRRQLARLERELAQARREPQAPPPPIL